MQEHVKIFPNYMLYCHKGPTQSSTNTMGLSLNNKIKKENAKMKFSQPKTQNKLNPRFYEIKDTINGFER